MMDGHFIRGYGDPSELGEANRQQASQIYVLPQVYEAAQRFLAEAPRGVGSVGAGEWVD